MDTTTTESVAGLLARAAQKKQAQQTQQGDERRQQELELFNRRADAVFGEALLASLHAVYAYTDQPQMTITIEGTTHVVTTRFEPSGQVYWCIDGQESFRMKEGPRGDDALIALVMPLVSQTQAA